MNFLELENNNDFLFAMNSFLLDKISKKEVKKIIGVKKTILLIEYKNKIRNYKGEKEINNCAVYIVTIFLKEFDEKGNPIKWDKTSKEYYARTKEIAMQMKRDFMYGKDEFYGKLIKKCTISDFPEIRSIKKIDF